MSDLTDNLLKNDGVDKDAPRNSSLYSNTKRKINEICDSLKESSKRFSPGETVELIEKYINDSISS